MQKKKPKSGNRLKTFLIINLSYFGDILLTGALCKHIKLEYPDSKVVFMVNEPFEEAARYLNGVDDVLVFDKRYKHKGLLGLLKFVFECKYRNKIDTAFIMYGNDRGILLSCALGAKYRVSGTFKLSRFLLNQSNFDTCGYVHTQDKNISFLKEISGKTPEPIAISYTPPKEATDFAKEYLKEYDGKELVGVCFTSKKAEKDTPIEDAIKLINELSNQGKIVLYTGAGARASEYKQQLEANGCNNFVDLSNKTSIAQLGAIIQKCKGFISVDTGSMHLAYAVKTPVVSLFYINDFDHLSKWLPKENLYNCKNLTEEITVKKILSALQEVSC